MKLERLAMPLLAAMMSLMIIHCGMASPDVDIESAVTQSSGYLRLRKLPSKKKDYSSDSRSSKQKESSSKSSKSSKSKTSKTSKKSSKSSSSDTDSSSDQSSKSSHESSKDDSKSSKEDSKESSSKSSKDKSSKDDSKSSESSTDDSKSSSKSSASKTSESSKSSSSDSSSEDSKSSKSSSKTSKSDSSEEGKGCSIIPGELIDPCNQPVFENIVPNAVDPGFTYQFDDDNRITVEHCKSTSHKTGLVDEEGNELITTIYGYGAKGSGVCTWPGMTFDTKSQEPVYVTWENNIPIEPYILTSRKGVSVVDTSIHWAYSLEGYDTYTIEDDGVPVVPHVHGGHDDSQYDGNPEFFFSPEWEIRGPQWQEKEFIYDNSQPAGTIWYHDHSLGITRLNVYAGLAGFFMIRDDMDTGKPDNPLKLPAFPYEAAFAIQDRMFKVDGSLFYPAFEGDPSWEDFIAGEGAVLPEDQFPDGGPTALAEFFGDVIVVNGVAWPKMDVEPRNYRLRLLNGCDSRFLVIRFYKVKLGEIDFPDDAEPLDFIVIGSDQSLATKPKTMDMLLIETGARYDLVFDFSDYEGYRIIMRNIGPDEPFSGDPDDYNLGKDFAGEYSANGHEESESEDAFSYETTDRVMAFDVVTPLDEDVKDEFDPSKISFPIDQPDATRTRQLALFEGLDEFGRLQPLLGSVEPATDFEGNKILFPTTEPYQKAGTAGKQMEGSLEWHEPTTENPKLDATEIWELWNLSGDAHPMHIHLVYFEVLGRKEIKFDSCTTEEDTVCDPDDAVGDGTYLVDMKTVESSGNLGSGFMVRNPTPGPDVEIDAPRIL